MPGLTCMSFTGTGAPRRGQPTASTLHLVHPRAHKQARQKVIGALRTISGNALTYRFGDGSLTLLQTIMPWPHINMPFDLSPNAPPFFRRFLGYTIGLMRLVFLELFYGELFGRDVTQRKMWPVSAVVLLPCGDLDTRMRERRRRQCCKKTSNTPALLNLSMRFQMLFHLPNRSGNTHQKILRTEK